MQVPYDPFAGESLASGVDPPSGWIPFVAPPRGSTFFVGRGQVQQRQVSYLGASRPLPSQDEQTSFMPPRNLPAQPAPHPAHIPPTAPPFASMSRSPPRQTHKLPDPPPATNSRLPLPTSSSILVHSGFWDLLAATGSRFYSPTKIAMGVANGPATPFSPLSAAGNASDPFAKAMGAAAMGARSAPMPRQDDLRSRQKKRISVDMVGKPIRFAHLVHASDADQTQALLTRWQRDGQGKVGEPTWANPIKEAVRATQRATGVAEAQFARDRNVEGAVPLRVVNGLPDSVINGSPTTERASTAIEPDVSFDTGVAVEDDGGAADFASPLVPPQSPFLSRNDSAESVVIAPSPSRGTNNVETFAKGGTTRFSPTASARPGAPVSFDRLPSSPLASPALGDRFEDPLSLSSFVPSLATIERAVAAKVFLETRYHAILKQRRPRETRKALLEKELARLNLSDKERMRVRDAWVLSESEYLRDTRNRVTASSFVKLKTIGHGAFGVVSLVREKGSGEVYAMKQIRKADMLKKGQEGHIRAERDLLATASTSTRWTVKLAYSFQDADHLYLVMQFMSGGDLLTRLIEEDTFSEAAARFYVAEMILSLREVHQTLGAIHRDIKPDNWLIDSNGHLAISDFGLATDLQFSHDGAYYEQHRRELLYKHGIDLEDASGRVPEGRRSFDPPRPERDDEKTASVLTWRDMSRRKQAFSVVGTTNYMSPEVLRGRGYGVASDWWSVGVIMFECLYGYPPFVTKSRQETRNKILSWRRNLRFPSKPRVSREAQDLIMHLICEPEDRLGSPATGGGARPNSMIQQRRSGFLSVASGAVAGGIANDGAEELMSHTWFRGLDWSTLHQQKPPFVPELSDPADCRYFDDGIEPEPLPAPEIAPGVPAPDTTRDPLLRHPEQGADLLKLRKELAFAGWTFKQPKRQVYDLKRGLDPELFGKADAKGTYRGRSTLRPTGAGSSFIRSLSV
ncbi:serine/threonine-protein kinase [Rhodotorula paludigena]|uniref:serine/threonine-protein kinase n=1 Tax=Rhodotorula paludigena TaxID=86838 RepID=UPI00317A5DF7